MRTKMRKPLLAIVCLLSSMSVSAYDFTVDGIYYNVVSISDLTCEVVSGDEEYTGDFIIPDKVTYNNRTFTVTEIGGAFYNCSGLTSVTIPNSVTEIGNYAFCNCSGLTSVTIPNSVTEIGSCAFSGCSGLTSVTIPNSVTEIGSSAFGSCSGLTSVTIPNSVTKIGSSAFEGCSGLTSVTIPNSVTEIGTRALYCENLQEVELGGGLLELPYHRTSVSINGSSSYYYYSLFEYFESSLSTLPSLKKLRIADSENTLSVPNFVNEEKYERGYFSNLPIKELYIGRYLEYDEYPFKGTPVEKLEFGWNCKNTQNIGDLPSLKTLILGENIEKIRNYLSCSFTDIFIKTSVPPTVDGTFENKTYLNANLYVPTGSMEAYQNAKVWKDFWNIKEWNPSSDITSISSIKNNAETEISVEGRSIRIESVNNSVPVKVYTASGSLVYQGTERIIPVNNVGIYIVRAGEQTKKVIVQ